MPVVARLKDRLRRRGAGLKQRWEHMHQERGATMFVVIAIMFALLLFTPILIDYASLHFTHRLAQTAADASAHAAAVSCAKELSINTAKWHDKYWFHKPMVWLACCTCWPEDMCVLTIYQVDFVWLVSGLLHCRDSEDQAKEYVERNGAELVRYEMAPFPFTFYYFPRIKLVNDFPILPVKTEVSVKRKVPMIYSAFYGRDFEVQAHARAEAFLGAYEKSRQLCVGPCEPWVGKVSTYEFKWRARIVE
jgi:hypothetical protein